MVARQDPDRGPVTLITSYVSIVTADGALVLARRTGKVRHGQRVISATAGGVIEPDAEGDCGDVDEAGMPSPLHGVLRETLEEIGLDLPASAPKPVAVFLANARNVAATAPESTPAAQDRSGRGQLVLTVLYLCRVEQTADDLRQLLTTADPSLGGFEVEDLVVLPTDGGDGAAATLAAAAAAQAAWLDQHGLLSCLYTAAVLDGPEPARKAFVAAFPDRPWWAIGGGAEGSTCPRVVRDPRHLLTYGTVEGVRPAPLEDVVEAWRAAWDELPQSLAGCGRAGTAGADQDATLKSTVELS